ncbi:MAG TPA: metallophosphoesterase [Povalibacter sp.]
MKSFRLVHFTDTHLSGDASATIRGVASLPAARAALADAQRRYPQPDGILLTGDLVQDDPAGYRLIRQVFGTSKAPVLCLAGNHDLPDHMRSELSAAPFKVGGESEFGRWLVVMLDTWVEHRAGGRIGPQQLAHLSDVLNAHRNHHVLICLHHHPIEMRSRWLDTVGLEDAADFLNIVRAHANVRGVLWGHVHQSLDSFVHGVRFMASPATCAQFVPHSDDFALDNRPPGYRVLELLPDGTIATEVVWLERYAQRVVA